MTRPTLRFAGLSAVLAMAAAGGVQCSASAAYANVITSAPSAQAATRPSLIVLIAIDQFRADYLQRFGPQMNGGLARLMRGGAWFTDAHHDHAITETAPGHATMLSGRFPRSTGIMMNSIGVEDESAPLLANGYGSGASPKRFLGTTLADWMRAADSKTRTLSVSMKDRAAILPNGKAPSDVYWYSPDGRFVTSTYYRKALPDWVKAFNDRQVPATYAGKHWTLLLPDSAYHEPDSVDVEGAGKQFLFPHLMPEDPFDAVNLIRASPYMDDVVATFALAGVRSLELGATARTDLLTISLSTTDLVGHRYGPDSREIHDQVLRVDRVIGRFLDSLYAIRDSSTVTVILTSDHGMGRIPELAAKTVTPMPVRASLESLRTVVRAKLRAAGIDTLAFIQEQNIVQLERAAFRKKALDPDSLLAFFATAARREIGVARVDRFRDLLADSANDVIARRWTHQFPSTVNIEMLITLTPMSTWGGNVASHGSPYDYDSHVPLIFSGFGVQNGTYPGFVRTVDIAPTLAAIAGVKPMEPLDGVPLRKALRERPASP
ncbi:MAG: alkaline phosphatase family protein [Gemmatimonadaceae bacterium]|nr:alkaline phosphatase family protein [Gemmatimonadaceae bacterium]